MTSSCKTSKHFSKQNETLTPKQQSIEINFTTYSAAVGENQQINKLVEGC